jgi:hypothetical protein
MPQVKTSLSTQRDRCNQRLRTVDEFIVGVPPKMVTAISVVIHKNSIKGVVCVLFALLTDVAEKGSPRLWETLASGISVRLPDRMPRRQPRLVHHLSVHQEALLFP